MAELPTPSQVIQEIETALKVGIDPTGSGAVDTRPGSDNAVLISIGGLIAARVIAYAADRVAARSPYTATGVDMEEIARDVFGISKREESKATGRIYLQRTGALPATNITIGTRFGVPATDTQSSVTFEATETIAVGAGATKAKVIIQCVDGGVIGNVSIASITQLLDPLQDSTWVIYIPIGGDPILDGLPAPEDVGGGSPGDTTAELQTRTLQRALDDDRQRGTRRAINAGSFNVPGIGSITVIEPLDGTLLIYAGDLSFELPNELRIALEVELENWRGLGVPALIRGYNAIPVTVTASIYMTRSLKFYDRAAIQKAAISNIKEYFAFSRERPDEYYVNAIESACFRANDEVQQVVLSSPLVNVQRPTDDDYGLITDLNRFFVSDDTIFVNVFEPLTAP